MRVPSSVTELVEGAELWHPDLWVGNSQNENAELDLDSAGVYLKEGFDGYISKPINREELQVLLNNIFCKR